MKVTKFVQVLIAVTTAAGLWGFFFVEEVVTLAEALDGHCVANCGGGGSSGGYSSGSSYGGTYVPSGPSSAELARQRREDEGVAANDKGLEYSRKGDYDTAIKYYKEAIRLFPSNSVIRDNLTIVFHKKGLKLNDIGNQYYEKEDYSSAIKYYKEALQHWPDDTTIQKNIRSAEAELKVQGDKQARERKLVESKTKVKQMLDSMSEEFGSSTLPTGSLGFMNPGKPLVAKDSKDSSSEGLQFMDPRQEEQTVVVKKRVVLTLPNKPEYKEGRMITGPGAQLNSAEKMGKWAKGASARFLNPNALERASGRAGIGFDTPGVNDGSLRVPNVQGQAPGVYSKSPAVTDEDRRRIPAIAGLEKQRVQAINKLAAQQANLEKLRILPAAKRPKDWSVQVANTKQAAINTKSEIHAADIKIGDALRLNKGKEERPAEVKKIPEIPPPPKIEKFKKEGKETWTLD